MDDGAHTTATTTVMNDILGIAFRAIFFLAARTIKHRQPIKIHTNLQAVMLKMADDITERLFAEHYRSSVWMFTSLSL